MTYRWERDSIFFHSFQRVRPGLLLPGAGGAIDYITGIFGHFSLHFPGPENLFINIFMCPHVLEVYSSCKQYNKGVYDLYYNRLYVYDFHSAIIVGGAAVVAWFCVVTRM